MAAQLTNALHLYRALLRECTYLPDSRARRYMRDHVIRSYREYLPRNHARRKEIAFHRQVRLLHRGRNGLSVLRRANEGYTRPLQKVLFWTYGRRGRRRRELMGRLMQLETPQDHKAVEALSITPKYSGEWTPPPAMAALLHSQAKWADNLDKSVTGSKKIRPKPDIPEKNAWGRPMPEKRVKNMMSRWYAKQVDHLMPPLPEPDYERLRALCSGQSEQVDRPVPRRRRVGADPKGETPSPLLDAKLVLDGPPKAHTFAAYVQGRPHCLTRRFLRRLWESVFLHVPKMTWDVKKQEWEVEWNIRAGKLPKIREVPNDRLAALFGEAASNR